MSKDEFNRDSVDATLARIEQKLDGIVEKQNDHEERISSIERWRYYLVAVFVAAGWSAKDLPGFLSNLIR
jgi:ribosomal 50S subunit-associated protein YjgA (DUF615 family)